MARNGHHPTHPELALTKQMSLNIPQPRDSYRYLLTSGNPQMPTSPAMPIAVAPDTGRLGLDTGPFPGAGRKGQ